MAKRKPKTYSGLKLMYSPVNQQWFVLWPGGKTPIERQQVLAKFGTLGEAERYADEISQRGERGERGDNPRRPPKQWMRDCVKGASKSAADPGAVCGALWYRKMSPSAKRVALAREGKAENPQKFETFSNWNDVLAAASAGESLWYHAPMDINPSSVGVEPRRGNKLRVFSRRGRRLSFIADAGHLSRFKRRVPQNNPQPWAKVFG